MKRIAMIVLAVVVTACGSGVLAPIPTNHPKPRITPPIIRHDTLNTLTDSLINVPKHPPAVDCVDSTFTKIIPCPNSGN